MIVFTWENARNPGKAYIENVYKTLKSLTPIAISNVLDLKYVSDPIVTRGNSRNLLRRCKVRTSTYGLHSIKYRSILNWNSLQIYLKTNLTELNYSKIKSITLEYLSLQKWITKNTEKQTKQITLTKKKKKKKKKKQKK